MAEKYSVMATLKRITAQAIGDKYELVVQECERVIQRVITS